MTRDPSRPDQSSLPFPTRRVGSGEATRREALLAHRFFRQERFELPGLAAAVHQPAAWLAPRGWPRVETDGASPSTETVCVALRLGDPALPGRPRAVLTLPRTLVRQMIDTSLRRDIRRADKTLTTFELGTLLWILEQAGGDWIDNKGGSFTIVGLLADEAQIDEYLKFKPRAHQGALVNIGETESLISLHLQLPDHSPGHSTRRTFTTGHQLPERALKWDASFAVIAGSGAVDAGVVDRLETGDLLVLDTPMGSEKTAKHPRLECGACSLATTLDTERTLEIQPSHGVKKMVTDKSLDLQQPAVNTPGELEVIVQAEMGQVKMTVGEAAELVPGQLLRFNRALGPEVWLRVGDQIVAEGEIVDYEGMMAVEITKVHSR